MKTSNLIRGGVVAVLMLIIQMSAMAEVRHMYLTAALKRKLVAVKPVSAGGYRGYGLQLGLMNVSGKPLAVDVEPALVFQPSDPEYQDLVLAGNVTVTLPMDTMKVVPVQTFCGKSYAHSPIPGLTYTFWKQGEPGLVSAMNFIDSHQLQGSSMAQFAVWAFTNNHDIAGIYDSKQTELSKQLAGIVARYKHLPVPQYGVHYEMVDIQGRPSLTGRRLMVFVDMEWDTYSTRNMSVLIYREDGSLYKEVKDKEEISSLGHKVQVALDPEKTPKGKYSVRLRDDDNTVWQEKTVVI